MRDYIVYDSVDKMNLEQLKKTKEPITEIRAINSSTKAQSFASSHFNNLENSIIVSKGCVITIIANLWKKKGIYLAFLMKLKSFKLK